MEENFTQLEKRFCDAVSALEAVEKWSDLKIIHSILQDAKDQSGPRITSEIAQAAIRRFFGEGYCDDAALN